MTNSALPKNTQARLTTLGLAGGCLLLAACGGFDVDVEWGQGELETRSFDLASFDSIDVDSVYDVEITVEEGATQTVSVETAADRFDDLDITVEDGELRLDLDGFFNNVDGLKVEIVMPALAAVTADGASDVTIEGAGGDLSVSTDGVASVDAGNYLAESVMITTDGASDAEVSALGAVSGSADGVSSIDIVDAGSVDVSADFAASVDRP